MTVRAPIEPIRAASRRLVRELGFMRGALAYTSLPRRQAYTSAGVVP
jgi:hypothetical protein